MKWVIVFTILFGFVLFNASNSQGNDFFAKIKTGIKFKKIEELLPEKVKEGLNPYEVMPLVQEAKKEFDKKNYDEANKILDDVIAYMENFKPEKKQVRVPEKRFDVSKINTSGSEDLPTISPDGKKLYFAYSPIDSVYLINKMRSGSSLKESIKIKGPYRKPQNLAEIQKGYLFRNYVSNKKADGNWSVPVLMDFRQDNKYWYAIEDISDDGKVAILFGNEGPDNAGRGDFYISYKDEQGNWQDPVNLGKSVNTKFDEDDGDLSSDGQVLFFDCDRPGGKGKYDIYFSEKKSDGLWSEPKNIGHPISTHHEEKFPFINKDQSRLYFSREHKGIMRLFVSGKVSKGKWSEPSLLNISVDSKHLGSPSLNETETHIYFYTLDSYTREFDIYYSARQKDGKWGTAKPVD